MMAAVFAALKKHGNAVRVVFSALLIALILLQPKVDLGGIAGIFSSIQLKHILYYAVLRVGAVALVNLRLRTILKTHNIIHSFPTLLYVYLIGMFYNQFLPTQYGGDVVKMYVLARNEESKVPLYSSVIFDRMTGLLTQLLIVLVVYFAAYDFIGRLGPVRYIVLGFPLAVYALLYLLVSRHSRMLIKRLLLRLRLETVQSRVKELFSTMAGYAADRGLVLKVVLTTVCVQSLTYAGQYFLGRSLHIDIHMGYYFAFVPLISILATLPVSMNGIGIREWGYKLFFMSAGATANQSVSLSFLVFLTMLLEGLVGGVVSLFGKYEVRRMNVPKPK